MVVLKLLLNGSLMFIVVAVLFTDGIFGSNDRTLSRRSNANRIKIGDLNKFIPKNYTIKLMLFNFETDQNFMYFGECNITIQINQSATSIDLHMGENINVLVPATFLNKQDKSKRIKAITIIHSYKDQIATIIFEDMISPGMYTLNMEFKAHANVENDKNFIRTTYITQDGNRKWFLSTNFQQNGARFVFPCFDEPEFTATFKIIVQCSQNYSSISNMVPQYTRNNKTIKETVFKDTPKMSTYHVAIIVTDFYIPSPPTLILTFHNRPILNDYISFANDVAIDVTLHLGAVWNNWTIYGMIYVNYVAIPDFLDNGKEIWGLSFVRETDIDYNKQLNSFGRKLQVARLIVQKTARQWFNNVIKPSSWPSMRLHNGIATLFGMNAAHKIVSDSEKLHDLLVVQDLHESLHLDTNFFMKPLSSDTNEFYDFYSPCSFVYYLKAPAVLRMLQHVISDDLFRKSVDLYFKNDQYMWTTLDDFWSTVERTLSFKNDSVKYVHHNLHSIINSWTNHSHYPVLKVTGNVDSNGKIIMLVLQENYNNDQHKWWIPVIYTTKSLLTNEMSSYNITWLSPRDTYIKLTYLEDFDGNNFIIVNAMQIGYYRVNYDNENWRKIAKYLSSSNYIQIHVLSRAQIINDAFHLMIAEKIDTFTFWDLTSYLSEETNYVAWYPMFKAMEYMSNIFPFSDKRVKGIKAKLLNILTGVLSKIQYNLTPGEHDHISCLREETIKWACVLGDLTCKRKATEVLKWHLSDCEKHKIWPWWQDWIYCQGLKTAKGITWYEVIEVWKSKPNNTILKFLSCSENPLIIRHSLKTPLIISPLFRQYQKNDTEIMNDHLNHFLFIVARHAKNEDILKYILQYFEEIKPKQLNTFPALIIFINHVYSEKQLNMINVFMERKITLLRSNLQYSIKKYKMMKRQIKKMASQVRLKIKKKIREIFPDILYMLNDKIELTNLDVEDQIVTYMHDIQNILIEQLQQIMQNIQHKIKKRLYEIEKQMNYLQILSNSKSV